MLLKRLSAIAAVFFLLTAFSSFAYADTFPPPLNEYPTGTDASTAVSVAEQSFGIQSTNIPGESLNYLAPPPELQVTIDGVQTSYGYLVYGSPHDLDVVAGRNRYVGYDFEGDDYTNLAYPPDATPNGANFETEDWVITPWQNPTVNATVQQQTGNNLRATPWDYQNYLTGPGYSDGQYSVNALLINGMNWLNTTTGVGDTNGKNGYAFDTSDGNTLWGNLYQYVNIMMPPTTYTWGIGRMWHMFNGYPYYVDIPMAPLISMQLTNYPQLIVEPSSGTINVGATESYKATYYPDGKTNGNGQDVTTSSNWTDDNTSVVTIGANTGEATGVSVGNTSITATYSPSGNALTGAATLTVQGQQSQTGGSGTLSFQAVNQPGIKTLSGQEIGGTLHRKANTAMWTDTVTATLAAAKPPQPQIVAVAYGQSSTTPIPPEGWQIVILQGQDVKDVDITDWRVSAATLTYPKVSPDFSYGNPVEPVGTQSMDLSAQGNRGLATAQFVEDWSTDGIGYGTSGPSGVLDTLSGSAHYKQLMAAVPQPYTITAAYTVSFDYTYELWNPPSNGQPGYWTPESGKNGLGGWTASGTLTVDGTGATPLSGTGGKLVIVGATINPQ